MTCDKGSIFEHTESCAYQANCDGETVGSGAKPRFEKGIQNKN